MVENKQDEPAAAEVVDVALNLKPSHPRQLGEEGLLVFWRGLTRGQVSLRLDQDYWGTLGTTLGDVTFPWFAYRDHSASAGR